ncbi:right-handed parallel beta-helix repeat-containing protein [Paenibacillus psychroresistens]|uniref:Right-handed parallel beta-helix repeat-containing protein n=1 Tax=Paenibacillus psychroresistens TaxID=1778678 RepID=A0A6B8RPT7_9BACL|nr:right-handed parallel beta-helix repeat-containing protein [Paenibacillus psychroresistens]QGQ98391.1 right-handed parallel beta-helix repeat-containing protein [Paenibacillus psychroresistens]
MATEINLRKVLIMGLIAAVLIALFGALPARKAFAGTQASFYVEFTSGLDTNAGTLAAPFKTIEKARAAVDLINDSMTGDIYIYLRGGTHPLTSSVLFDSSDSGTNGYKVYYKQYASEVPIVSGGENLSGSWTLYDAPKNIYRRSVTAGLEFRQLYVNDLQTTRARIPNITNADTLGPYYQTVGYVPVTTPSPSPAPADRIDGKYKINKAEIAAWANPTQVEMVVQPHWYHNNLRIAAYTTDATYAYVTFQASEKALAFKKDDSFFVGNAYYFENAYELLDAEGEWYLNTVTDYLYYKPRTGENMATVSVVAPKVEVLFDLLGTSGANIHDIEFSGITFKHSNWNNPSSAGLVATQGLQPLPFDTATGYASVSPAMVRASYANHLRFINNSFKFAGANGLQFFKGVGESQIVGNTLTYIAGNAINLDGFSKKNPTAVEQTKNILVGNNTISRYGQVYTNGIGILAGFVRDTIIEHNDISYGPYMGMQVGNQAFANIEVGMSNNKIRYNEVHHVMQNHDDGGGIYTLSRQINTAIFENYIHDIVKSTWAMSFEVAAIYLDNYSEFITAEHNVFANVNKGEHFNPGGHTQNLTWINNGTSDASVISNAGVIAGYTEPGAVYEFENEYIPYTPSGASASVQNQLDGASSAQWVLLSADGVGDYIDFTLPNVAAGAYTIKLVYKQLASRGQMQTESPAGTSFGDTLDMYGSPGGYNVYTVGSKLYDTTGDKILRFKVTGKNASASSYNLSFDKIILELSVLDQNFNSMTTGLAPTDWTTAANGGTLTVEAMPTALDKSLKAYKTAASAASMTAYKNFTANLTLGTIETRSRAEQTNATSYVILTKDSSDASAFQIAFGNNGFIQYRNSSGWQNTTISYAAGTWYDFKIVFDTNTDTYNFYVNQTLYATGVSFMVNTSNIAKTGVGIYQTDLGTAYFDNIKAY